MMQSAIWAVRLCNEFPWHPVALAPASQQNTFVVAVTRWPIFLQQERRAADRLIVERIGSVFQVSHKVKKADNRPFCALANIFAICFHKPDHFPGGLLGALQVGQCEARGGHGC